MTSVVVPVDASVVVVTSPVGDAEVELDPVAPVELAPLVALALEAEVEVEVEVSASPPVQWMSRTTRPSARRMP